MRAFALPVIAAAGLIAIAVQVSAPALAQHCEIVGCETQCWPVPHGRRCQRRCTRRCWHPPPPPRYEPRYVEPAPEYSAPPQYANPGAGNPGAEFVFLVGIGFLILCVLGALGGPSLDDEIAKIEQSTASARALAHDAESKAHAIDQHIEQTAREHFERGRAAADKEWTRE